MTQREYYRLRDGDVVKLTGSNIYLKVENLDENPYHSKRVLKCAKRFRVMFKNKDVYLNPKIQNMEKINLPFLDIFNAWYEGQKSKVGSLKMS